jgi:hypothetical protein
MESAIIGVDSLLGDFNSYFDILAGITSPMSRGCEIDTLKKSRHGEIEQLRNRFESLDENYKEDFIDAIVDMFTFDSSHEFIKKRMKDIYNIPVIGDYFQKFTSEYEGFDHNQKANIYKESIECSLSDLEGLASHLDFILRFPGRVPYEQILLSIQAVHLSRLTLSMLRSEFERKKELTPHYQFVQSYITITLARLDSFRRGKISDDAVYESISILSTLLDGQDINLLERKLEL